MLSNISSEGRFDLVRNLAGSDIPDYAILSHTWGADADELTFQDLMNDTGQNKSGYRKLQFCGEQAKRDGLQYFWVDTCCIDKSSSAELQEAINSMFRWYQNATKCYVYLSDVSTNRNDQVSSSWQLIFKESRWFTRGWTLQELIAPRSVEFFCSNGMLLGDKRSLERLIHEITGIEISALHGQNLSDFSIDERMSWAKNRETKREEDKAYCLLGIFDVHMPLIYGERSKNSFRRLGEEIEKRAKKHTLDDTPAFSAAGPSSTKRSKISHNQSSNHLSRLQTSEDPEPVYEYPTHDIDAPTRQSIIGQLYFPKIDERLTSLTAAQETTCRWFLAKSEYLSWNNVLKRQDHEVFLWIKGNPGTGKSTLMKLLFEEAKLKTKGDFSKITLSFFFLARGTIEERTTTGLYRSLLHQLFERVVELKDSLYWMTPDGARSVERNGWSEATLMQTLRHVVAKLGSNTLLIFVDALDECDQKQTSDMVSFFEELCEIAQNSQVRLQICFSSRHYPTIVVKKGMELTLEDEIGHKEDIQHYIKSKLRLPESEQTKTLQTKILQRSSGIFLWVVLVLRILNSEYSTGSSSIKKISKRLTEIPPGLNDLFEMILKRDGENLEKLQLCLKLILFANRPLKLQELYFATQIGLDEKCMGFWDQEDVNIDQMKLFVTSSSKGLAEVTKNKALDVQFVHESIRDFLFGKYKTQWSGGSGNFVGHGHDALKNCCLAQLNAVTNQKVIKYFNFSTSNFRESRNTKYQFMNTLQPDVKVSHSQHSKETQSNLQEEIRLQFPFLNYSVSNILHHANLAQQNSMEQADFMANFPISLWIFVNNYLENDETWRYTNSVLMPYILAERNLASLIRIYPRKKSCFNVGEQRYGPSIFAALATESHEAAQALLEIELEICPSNSVVHGLWKQYRLNGIKSMNIERSFTYSRTRDVRSYLSDKDLEIPLIVILGSEKYIGKLDEDIEGGPNLLFRAIVRGQDIVTNFLLESGARVNYTNEKMDTLLLKTIARGCKSIVKLLLEKGAEINNKELSKMKPLITAIDCGNKDITQLLLEKGADIDCVDFQDETPITKAIIGGHTSIASLLLGKGARFDCEKDVFSKALLEASQSGREEMANFLLKNGMSANLRDKGELYGGWTPLMHAAAGGHEAIVELFLENGAEINAKSDDGSTPLDKAVNAGFMTIVKLLLKRGAEVDLRMESRYNTLLRTISWGDDAVVALLLERDFYSEAENTEMNLLLLLAVKKAIALEILPILRVFLEKFHGINQKDEKGQTALFWAIYHDQVDIVKFLLDRGADIESKDKNGCTPLMYAIVQGAYLPIIKTLLEHRANINAEDNEGLSPLSIIQRNPTLINRLEANVPGLKIDR